MGGRVDTELLIKLGGIAGIAGIVLGVLTLVFQRALSDNVLNSIPKNKRFAVVVGVVTASFVTAILGIAIWAFLKESENTWSVFGRVANLESRIAKVSTPGGCNTTTDENGEFGLLVHGACKKEPFTITISVPGFQSIERSVSLSPSQRTVLPWEGKTALPKRLPGNVYESNGGPLVGAQVSLVMCPDAHMARSNTAGRFVIEPLPRECAKPPFEFRVSTGNGWTSHTWNKQPPALIARGTELPAPPYPGFEVLERRRTLDLRLLRRVSQAQINEKRSRAIAIDTYSVARATASATHLSLRHSTSSPVTPDVESRTHPVFKVVSASESPLQGARPNLRKYDAIFDVTKHPVGVEFQLERVVTYFNSFSGQKEEWAAMSIMHPTRRFDLELLFDPKRPMRSYELYAYPRTDNSKDQVYTGKERPTKSESGDRLVWTVTSPRINYVYKIVWKWSPLR